MADNIFYIFAGLLVFFSILTVSLPNLLHSALSLIASFFVTAAFYLLMRMEFTALAQIMVYVGGIVIFIVLMILLTSSLGEDNLYRAPLARKVWSGLVSCGLLLFLLPAIIGMEELRTTVPPPESSSGGLEAVGLRLLSNAPDGFIIPFEIISVLLLISLIGAVVIARKDGAIIHSKPAIKK